MTLEIQGCAFWLVLQNRLLAMFPNRNHLKVTLQKFGNRLRREWMSSCICNDALS